MLGLVTKDTVCLLDFPEKIDPQYYLKYLLQVSSRKIVVQVSSRKIVVQVSSRKIVAKPRNLIFIFIANDLLLRYLVSLLKS